ncbi:MAG: hypothetical protein IPM38_09390 [Ignavibacteria bacterium]|nr:hypothetical protein [Ignavibacteria bacterium]
MIKYRFYVYLTQRYDGSLAENIRKLQNTSAKIFGRRGNEKDFMFLAVDTSSPYNDTREKLEPGKPEQREYYAFFFEVDSEIGQASDVLKIVVP